METVSIETVTPEIARKFMSMNIKNNRNIRKDRVLQYASAMKAGEWSGLNMIVFDINGNLIDGQHRLLAVQTADIPVQFIVQRGAEAKSINDIDTGDRRRVADFIKLKGVPDSQKIAATLRYYYALRRLDGGRKGALNITTSLKSNRPTNTGYEKFYFENKESIGWAALYSYRLYSSNRKLYTPGPLSGLLCYLINDGGWPKDTIERFFDFLFEHNYDSLVAIEKEPKVTRLLRKRIIGSLGDKAGLAADYKFLLLVKAWNLYVAGRGGDVVYLKVATRDGEKVEIAHNTVIQ